MVTLGRPMRDLGGPVATLGPFFGAMMVPDSVLYQRHLACTTVFGPVQGPLGYPESFRIVFVGRFGRGEMEIATCK